MADRISIRRCAVYVRKSSEEGLDMSYNSLDAQTDACTAYISSQRHEGWVKQPKVYEDGGYSGGNMDRPGLKELLTDIEAGTIDIIVVYKIDRLTRSLTDFAKLNELLDRKEVSFVAVTQQFNTSTSMGRLTLNVLLSFAQFEREVSGERIRDKVAASKKKGMWMGGPVSLGYAVHDRKLAVVPAEAAIVQSMFTRYLELRSVHVLQRELEQKGIRTRTRTTKDGRTSGGCVLARGAISHMLKNPLYVGMVRYKDELHKGQHDAIVTQDNFSAVQKMLAEHGPGERARLKRPTEALLKGIVFDGNGGRLVPTYCMKNGVRYRYYTSARRLKSVHEDPQGIRVPAGDLEHLIITAVGNRLKDEKLMQRWIDQHHSTNPLPTVLRRCSELAKSFSSDYSTRAPNHIELIQKVQLTKQNIKIKISAEKLASTLGIAHISEAEHATRDNAEVNIQRGAAPLAEGETLNIDITSHLLRCGKQMKLVLGNAPNENHKINSLLIDMIAKTRRWYEGLTSGKYPNLRFIADHENLDKSYVRRLLTVALLAPDIVDRILTGNHSSTLTPERLRKSCPLPANWDDQRAMLLG